MPSECRAKNAKGVLAVARGRPSNSVVSLVIYCAGAGFGAGAAPAAGFGAGFTAGFGAQ
jgi:hypothetical protein